MRSPLPAIEIDPRLIECAVEAALRQAPGHAHWRQREALYAIEDAEARDRAFLALGQRSFEALGLGQPLVQALKEQALLCRSLATVRLVQARHAREEGGDYLSLSSSGGRAIVRVLPATMLAADRFLSFLRHELYHLADMIDPAFAYDPHLPSCDGSAARRRELVGRYRVLWATAIDGRMAQRGWGAPSARERRYRELAASFAVLGERVEAAFRRWWNEPSPRHDRILAYALDPLQEELGVAGSRGSSRVCPLCRFPWVPVAGRAAGIDEAVAAEIRRDFPAWTTTAGTCPRCLELYRSRPLSREAEAALPGLRQGETIA